MFALRDHLFDEALKHNIPLDSQAYRLLRDTMNGAIRFAHCLSFLQFILLLLFIRNKNNYYKPFSNRLTESMKEFTLEQKSIISSHYKNMNYLMVEHMLLSSPLILTIIVPVTYLIITKYYIGRLKRYFRKPLDKLDSAALATGMAV
jgi:hypothetical protein